MTTWRKCAYLMVLAAVALPVAAAELDLAGIQALTGLKGKFNEAERVVKVTFPRTDIKATVAGVLMNPELGLTAWAAFTRAGNHTMVMGDIVLLESEVNPVMSVALDNGLEVTALHNHFLWDNPKVMFMHIGGMGKEEKLAGAVGKEMGVNTWAAFAGSNDLAVVDGDFAMLESELQDVLKALRSGGINIVAIHNHMTFESSRMVFLHYWGIGPTAQLARTLRIALDTQHLD